MNLGMKTEYENQILGRQKGTGYNAAENNGSQIIARWVHTKEVTNSKYIWIHMYVHRRTYIANPP